MNRICVSWLMRFEHEIEEALVQNHALDRATIVQLKLLTITALNSSRSRRNGLWYTS